MNKLILLLSLLLISSFSFCNEDIAKTLLKADLATFTREIGRDIYVYSHRNAFELDVDNLKNPGEEAIIGLKEYQQMSQDHIAREEEMVGQGLYGSTDPFTIGDYGKFLQAIQLNDWVMSRIKIPANALVIDLRVPGGGGWNFPISEANLAALKDQCPSLQDNYKGIQEDKSNPLEFTSNKKWNDIFKAILSELGIQSILYRWGGHSPTECQGAQNNQNSAFVLVNNDINKENVDVFTKHTPQGDLKEEAKKIHYMVRRHFKTGTHSGRWNKFSSDKINWEDFTNQQIGENEAPENSELFQYMQETKFGCSKKYEQQDNFKYFPEKGAEVLIRELPLHLSIKVTPCLLEKTHYGPQNGNSLNGQ